MRARHVFLSPHMDDAVFSAGGLILDLKRRGEEVFIISIFTSFGDRPISKDAQRHILQSGYMRLSSFVAARNREDESVMRALDVPCVRLGFVDAGFRKNNLHSFVYPSFSRLFSGMYVPENELLRQIRRGLVALLRPTDTLYAPIGIGNHPDHVLVRSAAMTLSQSQYFWTDQPYAHNLRNTHITTKAWKKAMTVVPDASKNHIAALYRSQFSRCFPLGISTIREQYYSHTKT